MTDYDLHYVRPADIERFKQDGWHIVSSLARTHHGAHAVLMRRDGETGTVRPVHGEMESE